MSPNMTFEEEALKQLVFLMDVFEKRVLSICRLVLKGPSGKMGSLQHLAREDPNRFVAEAVRTVLADLYDLVEEPEKAAHLRAMPGRQNMPKAD